MFTIAIPLYFNRHPSILNLRCNLSFILKTDKIGRNVQSGLCWLYIYTPHKQFRVHHRYQLVIFAILTETLCWKYSTKVNVFEFMSTVSSFGNVYMHVLKYTCSFIRQDHPVLKSAPFGRILQDNQQYNLCSRCKLVVPAILGRCICPSNTMK
jgi:hypothetical protein